MKITIQLVIEPDDDTPAVVTEMANLQRTSLTLETLGLTVVPGNLWPLQGAEYMFHILRLMKRPEIPLHLGARFVIDTQRLWHVVCHTGTGPRYALISSFESGPVLERWIAAERA